MAFVAEDDVIEVHGGGDGRRVRARRVRRRAAAVAADDLRRGGRALRHPTVPTRASGSSSHDVGEALRGTEFKVFAGALAAGGVVRGINAGPRELPRSELDALTELAKQHGAKGLVWAFVQDGRRRGARRSRSSSPRARSPRSTRELDARAGDLLLIVADEVATAGQALGALRLELARALRPDRPPARHDILWVVEFPMFEWDAEEQRWDADAPPVHRARVGRLSTDPAHAALARLRPRARRRRDRRRLDPYPRLEVQQRVFELLGIGPEEAQARFGFLLDALRYGAPPHGGIAMGIDRIVAVIAGRENRSAT